MLPLEDFKTIVKDTPLVTGEASPQTVEGGVVVIR